MSSTKRNDPLGFAALTWQNFEFVEAAAENNPDVHRITQLALSLLGLIVLQHEKNRTQFDKKIRALKLSDLDWPRWDPPPNPKVDTLGKFIQQLRHVVAHGGIEFSSDSPDLDEVTLTFHDRKKNWHGRISAADLREFCYRFKTLLQETS